MSGFATSTLRLFSSCSLIAPSRRRSARRSPFGLLWGWRSRRLVRASMDGGMICLQAFLKTSAAWRAELSSTPCGGPGRRETIGPSGAWLFFRMQWLCWLERRLTKEPLPTPKTRVVLL